MLPEAKDGDVKKWAALASLTNVWLTNNIYNFRPISHFINFEDL